MSNARIPRARLNQIALGKLNALGVSTRMSADQERLEGTLKTDGALTNPMTGKPIAEVGFLVHGHDHLIFREPAALRGLPPQMFFDFPDMAKVLAQVQVRLDQRAAAVKQLAGRLSDLGLEADIDQNRLRAVATLDVTGVGQVRLEGNERGVFAIELKRPGRGASPIEPIAVTLDDLDDKMDLELILGDLADKAKELEVAKPAASQDPEPYLAPPEDEPAAPSPAPAAGAGKSPDSVPTMRPSEPINLGNLTGLLGEQAVVLPGAVLQKDLRVAGKQIRFAARVDGPELLAGKVVTPDGVAWTGHFAPADFPGVEDFVAGLLGSADVQVQAPTTMQVPKVQAPPEQPAPAPAQTPAQAPAQAQAQAPSPALEPATIGELGGQPLPVAGEVWVMNTLVEQDDGAEVRYVGIDIDGQPFGAPRVLPKETFERVFTMVSHGVYQLPVQIASVEPDKVNYFQLDPQRNRVGQQRNSRLAAFLSNFVPEAAAY